jgi:hypothetical protein
MPEIGFYVPVDLEAAVTSLVGLGTLAFIIGMWAKSALEDWRWTPWVVLGVVIVIAEIGVFILNEGFPSGEQILWTFILALFATGLETWGYEAISNGLGKVFNVGGRSDEAQARKATETLERQTD